MTEIKAEQQENAPIQPEPPKKSKPKKVTVFKIIERYAGYYFLRLSSFVVNALGEKKANKFGVAIGRIFYKRNKKYGQVAIKNLKFIYPEKSDEEIEHMALETLENFGKGATEFLRLPNIKDEELLRRTHLDERGIDILKQAYDKGKGVILLTAHFGNWEMMSARYNHEGFIVDAIARDPELKKTAEFMHRTREKKTLRKMYPNKNILPVMRALRQGRGIGILPDQHDMHGVVIDFLGRKARMAIGPAVLALKSGAAVVPTFALRNPDDTFELIIFDAIEAVPTGDNDADIQRLTQQFADIISGIIEKYPTQWLWFHDRWRPNVHLRGDFEPYVEED